MRSLDNISNIYFVGIGGIGMSALAVYFHNEGNRVAGYDKTPSDITRDLESSGIAIHYEDNGSNVVEGFESIDDTLIVYTPAVPDSFGELQYFRKSGYNIKKRAEVLGLITRGIYSLAVAGTHGKTTTSSILGHLLAATGAPVTAFVGGITNNYNGNLIQKGNEVVVVEADEFDRSFLQLKPNLICITSMDADHLDIYASEDELISTFQEFGLLVPSKNRFIKNGLPLEGNTVGIEDASDYCAQNIQVQDGQYVFDLKYPEGELIGLRSNLPGRHNLFNAITALAMAMAYGTEKEQLHAALLSYTGVNRRFTYRVKRTDLVLIDDYAHHPTEIAAVHQSVREMYPKEEVMAIFQPHLFSRTKDFMEDFARELSGFDEVVLLDIYPARELPISGVTSNVLLSKMTLSRKQIIAKEQLYNTVSAATQKIIVMMGAGDIGVEILKVTRKLTGEN
ncbi:UDP-N-acetylmuramate--L-alanine ligase [Dokdonia sp. Hel_I_53]|uniref:UDP-N-acetylmuramate--L-alanine ligase n=1 Tax=Dokdonia sp. Hel_I_53 TaxID=1566287 RepID=UPI00119B7B92|nr:UDP-N-acetylmuramate--L-alanine ligase [Dokdonia sp. Hel_I_53]TVZ51993.1 UDP-N-acetylmuramate--L-alanine ligase [Dokdonia sp. Hel_I_53]